MNLPDFQSFDPIGKGQKLAPPVRVPILYYHRVEENISPVKGVSPRIFAGQMEYL